MAKVLRINLKKQFSLTQSVCGSLLSEKIVLRECININNFVFNLKTYFSCLFLQCLDGTTQQSVQLINKKQEIIEVLQNYLIIAN